MSVMSVISAAMAIVTLFSSFVSMPDNGYTGDAAELEQLPEQILPIPDDIHGNSASVAFFLAGDSFTSDFVPSEEDGDVIDKAISVRNKEIADRFDTKLEFVNYKSIGGEAQAVMRTLVMAGDNTYSVFIGDHARSIPLISDNFFIDIKTEMPHIDLENPWWNKNVNDSINFGDKCCAITGAFNLHNIKNTGCLVFNKILMTDAGIDYPYKSVLEGTWTVDKFIEYLKSGHRDINGDGLMHPEKDVFSYSGAFPNTVSNLFAGFDSSFIVKNEEGLPSFNIMSDRTFTAVDKLIDVFSAENGVFTTTDDHAKANELFGESKLMFMDTTLSTLSSLRSNPDDFGVLPYPKLDEAQREYRSGIASDSSLVFIPQTNTNRELTSAVLEYMAYLSYRDVVPEYLNIGLIIKSARDIESEQMIELIANSGVFTDRSFISDKDLCSFVTSGNNTLASTYAKNSAQWQKKLDGMIEFWKE